MQNYRLILFDLDGTLTDPKLGITTAVKYALAKFKIEVASLDQLEPFIGPPLMDSFQEFYHFTAAEAEEAIGYYREYFKEKGIYENKVYEGIAELLKELVQQDKILFVATSKPSIFAKEIIRHFELDAYFKEIVGSFLDGKRTNKSEIIQYIVEQYPDITPDEIVMVGDRKFDIVGARQHGVDSIAVNYGYGSKEELEQAEPTYIVDSIAALRELLLNT